ncbi:hypothetical protein PRIC2_002623 [Phytophthora ramorum]
MASNNPSTSSPRVAFRSGPTSPPVSGNAQVPPYDSDGLESDDDTLLALSSFAKMEASRAPRQNEAGNFQQNKAVISSTVVLDDHADCLDIVQQAIDAAEDALARCPKYERREALTELLMHAKLEQAKKVSQTRGINAGTYHRANLWAAMLMQVQEMGRNYPKDPQVHELVYLVQQCVARSAKHEVPEDDDHGYSHPSEDQQKNGDSVDDETQQQEIEDDADLYGRLGEAEVDIDVVLGSDDDIGYRITEDIVDSASNQTEDGEDVDAESSKPSDGDKSSHREDTEIEELVEHVKPAKRSAPSSVATPRLRVLLPILTANITVKGVQVPRLPRGSNGTSNSAESSKPSTPVTGKTSSKTAERNSRLKFQFPEKELLQLLEDEEAEAGSARSPSLHSYRRFSPNSKITGAVPLRRKSFSMKRSPLKSTAFAGFGPLNVGPRIVSAEMGRASASPSITKPSKQLWAARRKSTTACHINAPSVSFSRRNSRSFSATKQQILAISSKRMTAASPNKASSGSPRSPSTSSSPSPVPSTQTQMVLRVRERTSDGVPELVISKKPVHIVVWHWNDRCIRVPFMSAVNFMELGPAQHGIMLRQLRYVKSMMHELPWAKAHLRSLLSKYTAKEVSKEELYPQLNALGQQVQREIGSRARQHRALTARKQRLTVTLTLASSVVNDTLVTKFGRRGRPHASRLMYDPTSPLQLRWRRKHGERSIEYLAVDEIQVIEVPDSSRLIAGAGTFGRGNKKAAAAVAVDPESCLSLVTATRSLDLQVASALHREWLANAVRDIVSFAQQYKSAKANTASSSDSSSSSDSMPSSTALGRRPRQLPSSRNVLLY